MAKELTLDVVARKNSKELSQLADEFDRVAKQADDFGNKLNKTTTFSKYLDEELQKTKVHVRELGQEFDATGNKDVFAKLKGAQSNLKSLERIKTDLTKSLESGVADAIPVVEKTVQQGISDGAEEGVQFLGQAFGSLPPEAQAGIAAGVAGAVAVAAPAIGATISGALLAGVGAAGIGVAIASQIHDPAVSGALGVLKKEIGADLHEATSAFGPVLIDAADRLGGAFARWEPGLEKAFDKLAGPADRLFTGFEKFGAAILPGLEEAAGGAGEVLDEISADLPGLGRDFGEFFRLITDGSHGGADALGQIIHGIGLMAVATGFELDLLEKVFTALEVGVDLSSGNIAGAAQHIAELAGGFHQGKDEAHALAGEIGGLGTAAGAAAGPVGRLANNTLDFHNAAMNAKLDSLTWADGLSQLNQAIKDNKGAFNDHTTAGRQDEEMYLRLASQVQEHAQKVMDSTGNAAAAARAFQDYKAQLDAAARSAHASQADIDALNAALDNTVRFRKGSVDIEVNVTGSGKALLTQGSGTGAVTLLQGSGVKFRAAGGPVTAGNPYIVGEEGPEMFVSSNNGYIVPADQTAALTGVVGGTGGAAGGVQRVQIDLTLNGETVRSLLVDLGRRSGFRTVDQLLPVGSAR